MGNAWYVSPLHQMVQWLEQEGISVPPGDGPSTAPTPEQVFTALESFPEYRVAFRRRDRKEKGTSVYLDLWRTVGSYAIEIYLLRVIADNQPAGTFVFRY